MPRHGRSIQDIAFLGVEFASVLKLAADVTHLYNPPLGWSGVHVPKDRVRIECACRRPPGASTACCRTSTRASSAPSAGTAAAACVERVVGIGKPIEGIRKQMVLIHPGAGLFTLGRRFE